MYYHTYCMLYKYFDTGNFGNWQPETIVCTMYRPTTHNRCLYSGVGVATTTIIVLKFLELHVFVEELTCGEIVAIVLNESHHHEQHYDTHSTHNVPINDFPIIILCSMFHFQKFSFRKLTWMRTRWYDRFCPITYYSSLLYSVVCLQ